MMELNSNVELSGRKQKWHSPSSIAPDIVTSSGTVDADTAVRVADRDVSDESAANLALSTLQATHSGGRNYPVRPEGAVVFIMFTVPAWPGRTMLPCSFP
jgi:hypothetical protein